MTRCVVEVGPAIVRAPREAEPDLVATALDCIDDDIALLDEQPVAVTALWREVFTAVLPDCVEEVVLICPTWWTPRRIDRVLVAAHVRATDATVLHRAEALACDMPAVEVFVEIATDLVIIWRAGRVLGAEPRGRDPADVARSVAGAVGPATTVAVDTPAGVGGAVELGREVAEHLRGVGVTVTVVDPDWFGSDIRDRQKTFMTRIPTSPRSGRRRMVASAAVAAFVSLVCIGVGVASEKSDAQPISIPTTLLVEGRLAVKVPAQWTVRRITSGPGSARVEVTAPGDSTAVLITQSQVPHGESLRETSAALRTALDEQQAGVFSQFNPEGRRADRSVATYLELRAGRQTEWAVFVDGAVRIGIGCQSAPGAGKAVHEICEEAIRSAHALL